MKNQKMNSGTLFACAAAITLLSGTHADAQVMVNLGVGFTQRAADAVGGVTTFKSRVQTGKNKTNTSLTKSKCDTKVDLRGITKFNGTPNPIYNLPHKLGLWRSYDPIVGTTGGGQTQRQWATSKALDLEMWIPKTDVTSASGYAEVDGNYSVIRHTRPAEPTFAHEIGHNYSAVHEHANNMIATSSNNLPRDMTTLLGSLSRGWTYVAPRYSNPNVKYLGATTGISGSRENALKIYNRRIARSRFR